jgi:hypothetical protein
MLGLAAVLILQMRQPSMDMKGVFKSKNITVCFLEISLKRH